MTRNIADPYRDWDAAYVLGALVPAERQEFEQHLADCAECSAAVGELAGLPGILGELPTEEALTVSAHTAAGTGNGAGAGAGPAGAAGALHLHPDALGPDTLRGLSGRVRRLRIRSRLLAGAIAVAACAASVGITVAVTRADAGAGRPQADATPLLFSAVTTSSLTASGTLEPEPWGTRIDWTCTYSTPAGTAGAAPTPGERYRPADAPARGYALVVTDVDGATTRVATWVAAPGSVATPTATTRIPAADIRSVEIRSTATGHTLLTAAP